MIDLDQNRFHPVAGVFPLMSAEELDELAADIVANGQKLPILVSKETRQIVDGRNRFLACRKAGVEPRLEYWTGSDLVSDVISWNLKRRQLNESQRAMVAAKIATLEHGGDRRSDQAANLPVVTQSDAAQMLTVSERTVRSAREVVTKGSPELIAAVEAGNVAVSAAAAVTDLSKDEQREIVARGEREILAAAKEIRAKKTEARRGERMATLAEISKGNAPLGTTERTPIILADPPWRYEHAESESRAIENQYPTMDLDEICSLDVASAVTPDAVLFLWATSPKLAEAIRVLESWGFTYRTCMVWDKERVGMGYWARQQHELILIATRGNPPTPSPANRPASVIRSRREDTHSRKPVEVYETIERMFPGLPKLELFCRTPRDGWRVWGNQAAG